MSTLYVLGQLELYSETLPHTNNPQNQKTEPKITPKPYSPQKPIVLPLYIENIILSQLYNSSTFTKISWLYLKSLLLDDLCF